MKKQMVYLTLLCLMMVPVQHIIAQDPVSIVIKEGITKVIKAVDLKIQRLQTKTIWLHDAQKAVENTMSKLKLDEITGWVEKQRTLYKDYFEELQKVKSVLTYYHKVKEITALQLALVKEYKRSIEGIKSDGHFSPEETDYMLRVYSGIIDESIGHLDGLYLVINAFTTQMTDEKRMEIIEGVRRGIQKNYDDLRNFSGGNIQLSLARAKDVNEINVVKNLYGL